MRAATVSGDTVAVSSYGGVNEFISLISFRGGAVGEEQSIETRLITAMGLSEGHLVFSRYSRLVGVTYYPDGSSFTVDRDRTDSAMIQQIDAPDGDGDFREHLSLDRDILLLRGTNQRYVYSLRNVAFHEAFRLAWRHHMYPSGRRAGSLSWPTRAGVSEPATVVLLPADENVSSPVRHLGHVRRVAGQDADELARIGGTGAAGDRDVV